MVRTSTLFFFFIPQSQFFLLFSFFFLKVQAQSANLFTQFFQFQSLALFLFSSLSFNSFSTFISVPQFSFTSLFQFFLSLTLNSFPFLVVSELQLVYSFSPFFRTSPLFLFPSPPQIFFFLKLDWSNSLNSFLISKLQLSFSFHLPYPPPSISWSQFLSSFQLPALIPLPLFHLLDLFLAPNLD